MKQEKNYIDDVMTHLLQEKTEKELPGFIQTKCLSCTLRYPFHLRIDVTTEAPLQDLESPVVLDLCGRFAQKRKETKKID